MFELTLLLELLAFLAGVVFFKTIKPLSYRIILIVLFATVLNEGLSYLGFYKTYHVSKYVPYNLFFIVEYLVIGVMYVKILKAIGKARIFPIAFILIGIVAMYFVWSEGLSTLDLNFITAISGGLAFFAFAYLLTIYNLNKIHNIKSDAVLWFSIGLIIAQFLLLLFINALRIESFKRDPNSMNIFKYLNTLGNIIYYVAIIYSFLCNLRFRKQAGT